MWPAGRLAGPIWRKSSPGLPERSTKRASPIKAIGDLSSPATTHTYFDDSISCPLTGKFTTYLAVLIKLLERGPGMPLFARRFSRFDCSFSPWPLSWDVTNVTLLPSPKEEKKRKGTREWITRKWWKIYNNKHTAWNCWANKSCVPQGCLFRDHCHAGQKPPDLMYYLSDLNVNRCVFPMKGPNQLMGYLLHGPKRPYFPPKFNTNIPKCIFLFPVG